MTTTSRDTVAMRASAIHAGYPGVPVLHGVSIEVAAGEMLAIVGSERRGQVHAAEGAWRIDHAGSGKRRTIRPPARFDRAPRVRAHGRVGRPGKRGRVSLHRARDRADGTRAASRRLPLRESARFGDRIRRARALRPARISPPVTSRNCLAASANERSSPARSRRSRRSRCSTSRPLSSTSSTSLKSSRAFASCAPSAAWR